MFMTRREVARTGLALALVAGLAAAALAWWTRDRVVAAGGVVVLVAGHDLTLGESTVGVGITGTLGLVGGRCVGFLDETRDHETVLVWPAGTQVSGTGTSVAVTVNGETLRLGDSLDRGTSGLRFPGLARRLPPECADAGLVDVTVD